MKNSQIAPDILELVKKNAIEMMANGETLRQVFIDERRQNFIWLSSDRKKVAVDQTILVDEKEFFIGLFAK